MKTKEERIDVIKSVFKSVREKRIKKNMRNKNSWKRYENHAVWIDKHFSDDFV